MLFLSLALAFLLLVFAMAILLVGRQSRWKLASGQATGRRPQPIEGPPGAGFLWWTVAAMLAVAATLAARSGLVAWRSRSHHEDAYAAPLPRLENSSYVTSDSCQACHPEQYASWHASFHRTMTQAATPRTVVAPFDDIRLSTDGQVAYLSQEGDHFWVDMVDPEWERVAFTRGQDTRKARHPPRVRARIAMTTGSHHFQAYWIRSDYGRELWQFPWRFHLGEQRWIHRKDIFLGPPDWRPGMHFKVWNDNCIFCHSTGGQPGLNPHTNSLENTQVAELGIACEACHGPARDHVRQNQNPVGTNAQYASTQPDPAIVNPVRLAHDRASEICGSCHAHFIHQGEHVLITGSPFRPGDKLASHGGFYRPEDEANTDITSRYWADGTNRSGGREFMGMKESACYVRGELSCLSCHSMHDSDPNDQLAHRMDTNEACYQCHETYRQQLTEHTHHPSNSSGSVCYNCHMPHTNFALFKAIRSHRIDIPRIVAVTHKARPNACNLCHLDKSLQWTAQHLSTWYDRELPELSGEERRVSGAALWLLRGDAGQRVIAAWHAGWGDAHMASGREWLAPMIAPLLNDSYSAVRWVAYASLRTLPGFREFEYEFDGPMAERQMSREQATELWRKQTRSPPQEIGAALQPLFDDSGQLRTEVVEQLIQRRDDGPISSVE